MRKKLTAVAAVVVLVALMGIIGRLAYRDGFATTTVASVWTFDHLGVDVTVDTWSPKSIWPIRNLVNQKLDETALGVRTQAALGLFTAEDLYRDQDRFVRVLTELNQFSDYHIVKAHVNLPPAKLVKRTEFVGGRTIDAVEVTVVVETLDPRYSWDESGMRMRVAMALTFFTAEELYRDKENFLRLVNILGMGSKPQFSKIYASLPPEVEKIMAERGIKKKQQL
jgi:hypothetical protein